MHVAFGGVHRKTSPAGLAGQKGLNVFINVNQIYKLNGPVGNQISIDLRILSSKSVRSIC